jgi:hypothetical protein
VVAVVKLRHAVIRTKDLERRNMHCTFCFESKCMTAKKSTLLNSRVTENFNDLEKGFRVKGMKQERLRRWKKTV